MNAERPATETMSTEILTSLARIGVQVRPVATQMSLTVQISADSAVAHHLGTDLTSERAHRRGGDPDAWTFRWVSCAGGVHTVTAVSLGVSLTFQVDLVTGVVCD